LLPCKPKHEFRAHGATPGSPFAVPVNADDLYRCFTFQAPFGTDEQATAWAPIIDDARVVHHWILYAHKTQPTGCTQAGRTFLMGWAPGGHNTEMPAEVGLDLPDPGAWLSLEIHYNNKARVTDARDRTGVAFCSTETPRKYVGGTITLGAHRIAIPPGATNHEVTSEIGGLLTRGGIRETLQVIGSWPHMHQLGVGFRTEITRGGVTAPMVSLGSWNFHDQRLYPPQEKMAATIAAGDAVKTTCVYKNPGNSVVRFGEGTNDEMCLNFVIAYPIDKVSTREWVTQ
jgi:hypothetical protein